MAQIGRTLARALGVNEDLTEAICLGHDLGHPAFGHSGEQTLNELMADHGGFDHNRQTLRIVEKLERRFPGWPGLNLSWEVREGLVKHETEYDVSDASGYDPDLACSLEGQIANVADELAYTAHDLDDGLRAGLISPLGLQEVSLWQELTEGWDWIPAPSWTSWIVTASSAPSSVGGSPTWCNDGRAASPGGHRLGGQAPGAGQADHRLLGGSHPPPRTQVVPVRATLPPLAGGAHGGQGRRVLRASSGPISRSRPNYLTRSRRASQLRKSQWSGWCVTISPA